MILTVELSLILLTLLGLGGWAIISGIRLSKKQPRVLVSPQELSRLAQPYKTHIGEAVAIYKDVRAQAETAPQALHKELTSLASRLEQLIVRALPRAQHGTSLAAYLLELNANEPQYSSTKAAAEQVDAELGEFVSDLKTLRGKVYQVLTDATNLGKDSRLARDLEDALIEVEALESAFGDLKLDA